MDILEKVKYFYLLSFLILLMSTLVFLCLKITNYILPFLNRSDYLFNERKIKHISKMKNWIKIFTLSITGILISMAVFAIINDKTIIEISSNIINRSIKLK